MHPSRDVFARASTRGVSRVDPVDEGRSLWLGASIEPPQIHAPFLVVSRNVAKTCVVSLLPVLWHDRFHRLGRDRSDLGDLDRGNSISRGGKGLLAPSNFASNFRVTETRTRNDKSNVRKC